MGFDIFSLDAANHAQSANIHAQSANSKADTNLNASIALLQMVNNMDTAIHEMRDFQHRRFNDLVDANNRRADENQLILKKLDEQNEEIKDLHKKIAELQVQLSNTNR